MGYRLNLKRDMAVKKWCGIVQSDLITHRLWGLKKEGLFISHMKSTVYCCLGDFIILKTISFSNKQYIIN